MTAPAKRRYYLLLYALDPAGDLYWPIFDDNDEGVVARLTSDLRPLAEAFAAGELWTDDGQLIWRRGTPRRAH